MAFVTKKSELKNGITVQLKNKNSSKAFTLHTADDLETIRDALIDFLTNKYKEKGTKKSTSQHGTC